MFPIEDKDFSLNFFCHETTLLTGQTVNLWHFDHLQNILIYMLRCIVFFFKENDDYFISGPRLNDES